MDRRHKGNNKITEHRAIFQRERQNSLVNKQKKSFQPQIACRIDYIMIYCLIDAVHKYIIKNMGTSRKRPSKINKIPSKRIKQPTYVFLRLITKVHQPCKIVENKR
jgi:hypothetical protein